MGDILHQLRSLDYGTAVQRALRHLESLCGGNQSGGIPGIGEELNEQIVDEIIFQQQRGRAGYNKGLNCLQEIQLLEIFIQYFKTQQGEWATKGIFRALFGVSPLPLYRADLLQKFVSMAIGVQCASALNAVAVWMQVQGCGSEPVTKLVRCLTDDYCVLTADKDQHSILAALPDLSNHFTCNFITAVTHIYHPTGNKSKPAIPCVLLHLVTTWLSERPQLCLFSLYNTQNSSYTQQHRPNLWTSPSKPNPHTPIPGLVSWCTSASLLLCLADNTNSKNSSSSGSVNSATGTESDTQIWSKLHLALLECIVSFTTIPGASRLELLTLGDMNRIVRGICGLLKDMPADSPTEARETAVERVVQVLQVSLSTGAFRCSLSDLKSIMNSIPENRLLHILAQQHLSIAPPQMHNVTS